MLSTHLPTNANVVVRPSRRFHGLLARAYRWMLIYQSICVVVILVINLPNPCEEIYGTICCSFEKTKHSTGEL